jgi:uncharacterized protein
MNKFATRVMAFALCATLMGVVAAQAANSVRISQVYGGGGNTGAIYNQDFVELFNNSGAAINIGGWSIQYGSATGVSFGSTATNMYVFAANTMIQPCKYLLVGMAFGAGTGAALPTVDFTGVIALSGTTGKVALINNSTGVNACSGNTVGGIYVDVASYGGNCFETATGGVTTNPTAFIRNGGGTVDTDNNSTDFAVAAPTPRNSASPASIACLATPTRSQTWGAIKTFYR